MIKKLIGFVLALAIMSITAQALDKRLSYDLINQCKYDIDKTGKHRDLIFGVIAGISQAYLNVLQKTEIDNEYASLDPGEFGVQMCRFALNYRKKENKRTGGKYDVTQFYNNLLNMGYYMTLPPTNDTNTD